MKDISYYSMLQQRKYRYYLWILLIASAFISALSVFAIGSISFNDNDPDAVARVNGQYIYGNDIYRIKVDLVEMRERLGMAALSNEQLEQDALRRAIHRQLMLQEAERRNIVIGEDEFDQRLADLRKRFSDLKQFAAWMHRRGLGDETLIRAIHDDLLIDHVIAALTEDVSVSEQQYREFYDRHQHELPVDELIRLRIIVVDAQETAQLVLDALSEGEDFSRLARGVSLGTRATEGGDTGWIELSSLPEQLRRSVMFLEVGQAAGPIEKNTGEFLVVALAGRRPVYASSLVDARQAIDRRLRPELQRSQVGNWLAIQEEQASIEIF